MGLKHMTEELHIIQLLIQILDSLSILILGTII